MNIGETVHGKQLDGLMEVMKDLTKEVLPVFLLPPIRLEENGDGCNSKEFMGQDEILVQKGFTGVGRNGFRI